MELMERISFTDHVREWVAGKGRFIDGASIPRALWTAVGSPYVGRYRRPSIIHDIACADALTNRDRLDADKMFYRACRSEGLTRVESAILYCGVRFGAWMSGGHLMPESILPRLAEDILERRHQEMFQEVSNPVVRDADRLGNYSEEVEADVLEQAFDASLERMNRRLLALSTGPLIENFPPRSADGELTDLKFATPASLTPGHAPLSLISDLEFDERLIDSPCGEEDRVPVDDTESFPHSAICYLVLNGRFGSARGTGFFISPDTIVTAGHCLHGRFGYIRSAQVIAGRDGENWPYEPVTSTRFRVCAEWSRGRLAAFDYGVIRLSESNLGQRVGHFDIAALSDAELLSSVLTTAGYPADIEPSTRQHVNSGPCDFVEPQRLGYSLDTWKGASGSPVWTQRDGRSVAVGIHNYGHCPNRATRINARVLGDLQGWIDGDLS